MDKRFLGILVAVIIILGGVFWLSSGKNTSNSTSTQPSEHIEGQGSTGVKLVEYGDFECPYCEEYFPIVKQIAAQYSSQIYFQFRNLPLTQIHLNAFAGARAAEAASLQGQFWQMHDALYTYQSQWVPSNDPQTFFDQYAQALGLNLSKFETDYASTQVNNTINADIAAFAKTGAQEATPSFFLDGTQIQPAPTVASFESFINAEIAKKTGSKTTTPAPTSTTGNQSVQK